MKHYRIKNRFRFITFLSIVLLLLCSLINLLLGLNVVKAEEPTTYVEVKVVSGDTLWNLAQRYGSDSKDIREVVYEISSINNVTAATLQPGQTILIPEK